MGGDQKKNNTTLPPFCNEPYINDRLETVYEEICTRIIILGRGRMRTMLKFNSEILRNR